MKQAIDDYLSSVRRVYDQHGAESQFDFDLGPGATSANFQHAEKELGQPLDPMLRALWSIVGTSNEAPLFVDGRLLCSYTLLSMDEAMTERGYYEKRAPQYNGTFESSEPRDPRVGPGWFSSGWMPFAAIEGGSVQLLVDHCPLGSGSPGQIIGYVHDPDEMVFVADSLVELLPKSLAAIEQDPLEFLCVF